LRRIVVTLADLLSPDRAREDLGAGTSALGLATGDRQAYDFCAIRIGDRLSAVRSRRRYYEDGAPEELALPDFGPPGAALNFKREG